MAPTDSIRRPLLATAVLALVFGFGACGSGDDNSGETSAQGNSAQVKETAATTPDESAGTPKEQVAAFLAGFRRDFIAGNGKGFCNRLTAAGRRDAIKFSRQIGRGPTCEGMVRELARMNREAGTAQPKNKVVSIKIDGNQATAVVRAGDRPPSRIKLINHDGQWKLPDPGFSKALQNAAGNAAG